MSPTHTATLYYTVLEKTCTARVNKVYLYVDYIDYYIAECIVVDTIAHPKFGREGPPA